MDNEKIIGGQSIRIENTPCYYVCHTQWDFGRPYSLNYGFTIVNEHPLFWAMKESKALKRHVFPVFYESIDPSIAEDFKEHITDNNLLSEIEVERLVELEKRKQALKQHQQQDETKVKDSK